MNKQALLAPSLVLGPLSGIMPGGMLATMIADRKQKETFSLGALSGFLGAALLPRLLRQGLMSSMVRAPIHGAIGGATFGLGTQIPNLIDYVHGHVDPKFLAAKKKR